VTTDYSDLRQVALAAATATLASRFPGASFGLVAGSIMRGEGTTASDIDLVVIFSHLDAAWRESFELDGFPVEAFVHDHETIRWFMDQDAECGYPIIVNMIVEGQAIGPDTSEAKT
jgi:hypothetical protein